MVKQWLIEMIERFNGREKGYDEPFAYTSLAGNYYIFLDANDFELEKDHKRKPSRKTNLE